MYKIGISDDKKTECTKSLYNHFKLEHWDIEWIDLTELSKLHEYNVIIIKETSFHETCESLLVLKKMNVRMIYLISKDDKKNADNSNIYLNLGADICFPQYTKIELIECILNTDLRIMNTNENNLVYKSSGVQLSYSDRSILLDGAEINLTINEYAAMDILNKNFDKTVTYQDLAKSIWGNYDSSNLNFRLANLIFHLRNKLRKNESITIFTVRSIGYRLASTKPNQK